MLPRSLRLRAWAGPLFGLLVWTGFELAVAPALALSQAGRSRPLDRLALADHLLYGFVLAETRRRPRCGKKTLALQFLMEGARNGDTSLFISNAETPAELEQIAASHGWNLSGIELLRWEEKGGTAEQASAEYTLFPAAEVEVGETFSHLFAEVERLRPARLAIDSISALRVLARDPAFYRRQLRRLRDFLAVRACTTVLVDDLSVSVARLLRRLGHEVRCAGSGGEALAEAARYRPDVVLLDIGLPDMDGADVAKRLRELLGQEPLLAAMSGFGQESVRRRSLASGCDRHMTKPIAAAELRQLLAGAR